MVGWLNGHEFEQAPGDGEGQGSLACCSPWGRRESDMTEQQQQSVINDFSLNLFLFTACLGFSFFNCFPLGF